MFNHICFDCRIEAEMRGTGISGNKKTNYKRACENNYFMIINNLD